MHELREHCASVCACVTRVLFSIRDYFVFFSLYFQSRFISFIFFRHLIDMFRFLCQALFLFCTQYASLILIMNEIRWHAYVHWAFI